MRAFSAIFACSAALCLSLAAGQAFALSAQSGNGCSSDPDAPGYVHCTDWEPSIDVNNTQGNCPAIKTCIVGNCSARKAVFAISTPALPRFIRASPHSLNGCSNSPS